MKNLETMSDDSLEKMLIVIKGNHLKALNDLKKRIQGGYKNLGQYPEIKGALNYLSNLAPSNFPASLKLIDNDFFDRLPKSKQIDLIELLIASIK